MPHIRASSPTAPASRRIGRPDHNAPALIPAASLIPDSCRPDVLRSDRGRSDGEESLRVEAGPAHQDSIDFGP